MHRQHHPHQHHHHIYFLLSEVNLIREDKVAQMYSAIQTGAAVGMQTLDQCLSDLVAKGVIARDVARDKAKIPENF